MNVSDSMVSPTGKSRPPRNKALLAWMIISQVLGVIPSLALGCFGIYGVLLVGTINLSGFFQFLFPLFMLIPLAASWFAYAKQNEKLAWILTSVPVLYACLDIVIIQISTF